MKWEAGKQLIEKLYSLFGNVRIVIYLRRQDFYLESLWSQHVKAGWTTADIYGFAAQMDDACNYNQRLKQLSEAGINNIDVRVYEEGFDTVRDFLAYIHLDQYYGEFAHAGRRKNERVSIDFLNMIRVCNSVLGMKQYVGMLYPVQFMPESANRGGQKEGNIFRLRIESRY